MTCIFRLLCWVLLVNHEDGVSRGARSRLPHGSDAINYVMCICYMYSRMYPLNPTPWGLAQTPCRKILNQGLSVLLIPKRSSGGVQCELGPSGSASLALVFVKFQDFSDPSFLKVTARRTPSRSFEDDYRYRRTQLPSGGYLTLIEASWRRITRIEWQLKVIVLTCMTHKGTNQSEIHDSSCNGSPLLVGRLDLADMGENLE